MVILLLQNQVLLRSSRGGEEKLEVNWKIKMSCERLQKDVPWLAVINHSEMSCCSK